jgi:acyl phosphate:glycerol-3-phosphate acyltransferase
VIDLLLKVLLSYLLGAIVGSQLVGRLKGGVDIRNMGSGNAGATNALRTQGKTFALWVLLVDLGKGFIAVRVFAPLLFPGLEPPPLYIATWEPVVCGLMAIVGHVYPVWHGFRGGKGVATLVGVVLGLEPSLMLPMLLTWFLAVMLFGYVSLASMLAAASIPVYVSLTGLEPGLSLTCFGVIATALIVYTHRGNIARMRGGTEPRARRLWLFGKGR